MRRLAPFFAVLAAACGGKVEDDPFNQTTDPSTDPTETTDDPTNDSDDSSSSAGSESSTDDPSTTMPASMTDTEGTSTEADSSGTTMVEPGVCGDGMLSPDEVCDGDMFGEKSCEAVGFQSGQLLCNESCQGYSTENCYICGNGAIEPAEACDGPLDDDITCESEGFTAGEISCNMKTCQYDTSECSLCGDGVADGSEVCDGDDLLGMDCASIGFEMGALACNAATCSYDFSGCTGGQYLQDFEGGVLPPEFQTSGNAQWSVTNSNPIAGTFSAVSGNIGNSQTSNLTLAVTYAVAGTVEFTHEESTEDNYDYLEFYIDNVLQEEWSGVLAAQTESYPVAAGDHTLEWRYTKDGSLDEGSDQVWIDDIALTGGVPTN
jgi:hypothetical protein